MSLKWQFEKKICCFPINWLETGRMAPLPFTQCAGLNQFWRSGRLPGTLVLSCSLFAQSSPSYLFQWHCLWSLWHLCIRKNTVGRQNCESENQARGAYLGVWSDDMTQGMVPLVRGCWAGDQSCSGADCAQRHGCHSPRFQSIKLWKSFWNDQFFWKKNYKMLLLRHNIKLKMCLWLNVNKLNLYWTANCRKSDLGQKDLDFISDVCAHVL